MWCCNLRDAGFLLPHAGKKSFCSKLDVQDDTTLKIEMKIKLKEKVGILLMFCLYFSRFLCGWPECFRVSLITIAAGVKLKAINDGESHLLLNEKHFWPIPFLRITLRFHHHHLLAPDRNVVMVTFWKATVNKNKRWHCQLVNFYINIKQICSFQDLFLPFSVCFLVW